MPPFPPRGWSRSTSVRIALIQAVMLVVAIGGAGLGGWLSTRGLAERDARDRISLEIDAVANELSSEGLQAAVAAVAARAERPGALEYRLETRSGTVVAGDLTAVPASDGWSVLDVVDGTPGFEGKEKLLIRTQTLADGSRLVVGDDLGRAEGLRDGLFRTFLAWGLASIVAGLVVSLLLIRRALARMDDLVRTVARVAEGDLTARAEADAHASSSGDDIDQLAEGINQMLERIDQLVGAVRRVSADVAHDLRTPLSHVRQKLEIAATAPTVEARTEAITAASEGVTAALRVFDAMLRLTAIDVGGSKTRFVSVDLDEVADRVVDAYRPEIESSGRTLKLVVAGGARLMSDGDLLAQALANLLENALKHSRPGAKIDVIVNRDDQASNLIVQDDGPGIPPDLIETALRPFARLDAARSTPGAGLGLPIADAVARLHGGSLTLETSGPGVRAILRLPVAGRVSVLDDPTMSSGRSR